MKIFDQIFGNKKKVIQTASEGVDFVKTGLSCYLLLECKATFDEGYAEKLVPAVVNFIFSDPPSNETGRNFIKDKTNRENIKTVIINSIKPVEKLKQIITDAVKVKIAIIHTSNPELDDEAFFKQCRKPFQRLKDIQILQEGGQIPDLNNFISNASTFMKTCKQDLELYKNKV